MNTYRRILSYAKPWRRFVPAYLIFSVLGVAFGLYIAMLKPLLDIIFDQMNPEELSVFSSLPPLALSKDYVVGTFYYFMLQAVNSYGKFGALVYVCVIVILFSLLSNAFRYLASVVMGKAKAETIRNLRIDIYKSVSALHIGYFTDRRKGDLISRISNDIQQIESSLTHNLKVIFREPFTVIVYFWVLIVTSPTLTLFTMLMVPVAGILVSMLLRRLKRRAVEAQKSLGRQMNILDETISGMRVIKAFNATGYINRIFSSEVKHYADVDYQFTKRYELASPVSELLGGISIAGILIYGGSLVLAKGTLSPASFIMFLVFFTQILQPTKAIAGAFTQFQKGIASGERVFEVIDTKPAIVNKPDAKILETFESELEFRNVSFSYGTKKVLDNVSFTVKKGETVALVGPSGGGKSTLANLIPRFYDPDNGEVLIDGISLRDYDFYSLRKHMGIVTQEAILFNDTILNNIAFGLENVEESRVVHAAKIANAHDFIMQEPEGYQRLVGERGNKISGGQKQRITIARALFKNPPILILDEATSALDSKSEMLVQEAIYNLMKNRTSIVIAHRLSTIQNANKILVVADGKITEQGTHTELMKVEGIYHKLVLMQGL
ncbi:MAG: ABC transporter ATP-binding protein [Cyclobacteriaceae bacterium]|nr:ABC transporter ATP-binding protein [Cyclobacteriaceae bacterium]